MTSFKKCKHKTAGSNMLLLNYTFTKLKEVCEDADWDSRQKESLSLIFLPAQYL